MYHKLSSTDSAPRVNPVGQNNFRGPQLINSALNEKRDRENSNRNRWQRFPTTQKSFVGSLISERFIHR